MDNFTHSLIGLAASKAGLEKLSPGTTALCILAANAPDADIVTAFVGGRWFYLHHHRGITHSVVGTLALALLLPLVFYLIDLLVSWVRKRSPTFRLKGAILASLIVSATHPLMDWTNNYGVRFLLPWNARWFYGDLVFILDPILWVLLGGAVFLVTSNSRKQIAGWLIAAAIPTFLVFFGPINRGGLTDPTVVRVLWILAIVALLILFQKQIGKRWGFRVPQVAIGIALVYIGSLFFIHIVALRQAKLESARIAAERSEQVMKVAAMPTLANPFHWQCVFETERAAYRFELSLIGNDGRDLVRHEKPQALNPEAIAQAAQDPRTQIFLGFARFPVARIVGEDCASQTLVQFADLRYTEPGSDRGTFSLQVPVDCPVNRSTE
ncbi:MAG: metal-dependent hydrolase [Acidobacteriota bacterium]|nr:metal-dependent hydrolase [Acidobacteriota bacterium]